MQVGLRQIGALAAELPQPPVPALQHGGGELRHRAVMQPGLGQGPGAGGEPVIAVQEEGGVARGGQRGLRPLLRQVAQLAGRLQASLQPGHPPGDRLQRGGDEDIPVAGRVQLLLQPAQLAGEKLVGRRRQGVAIGVDQGPEPAQAHPQLMDAFGVPPQPRRRLVAPHLGQAISGGDGEGMARRHGRQQAGERGLRRLRLGPVEKSIAAGRLGRLAKGDGQDLVHRQRQLEDMLRSALLQLQFDLRERQTGGAGPDLALGRRRTRSGCR